MKLEIYGKNYNPSDSLKAVTEKKSAKLARRLKGDDDAQVKYTVTLENGVYRPYGCNPRSDLSRGGSVRLSV